MLSKSNVSPDQGLRCGTCTCTCKGALSMKVLPGLSNLSQHVACTALL